MDLAQALRLPLPASYHTVSLVGAGGKTTALFQLAQSLIQHGAPSVILTNTTHLGDWQVAMAEHHVVAEDLPTLQDIPFSGITLVTGGFDHGRVRPVNENVLTWLRENCRAKNIPLLIEADGSRQKSLKAPAAHEPPIPEFSDIVIVVAGLSVLGQPLTDEHVHRAEVFSTLGELPLGQPVDPEALGRVLTHPQGGLKNIPPHARRVVLLNQADTPALRSIGGNLASTLLDAFDSVIVSALQKNSFQTFEQTAGIILAAGKATRFGAPKQILDWKGKPFVRQVAETALHSGLWPVVVVTGAFSADVESALSNLPVKIIHNPNYTQGQSTSIRAGIEVISRQAGAAIFLLADQPQIPTEVIRALVETHTRDLSPIIAPLVLEEKRANPVLFDRVTFPSLLNITGDVGGRAIFSDYKVEYLPWHDDRLLLDVDKPEDYQRLVEDETL